jgi:hypothetical protein
VGKSTTNEGGGDGKNGAKIGGAWKADVRVQKVDGYRSVLGVMVKLIF